MIKKALILAVVLLILGVQVLQAQASPLKDETTRKVKPKIKLLASNIRKIYSYRCSKRTFEVVATGYCSCSRCCGKNDGITASGKKAHWGTIAGPKWMSFGTKLLIEGFGSQIFIVEDRGGAIVGNRIDIWFPTHEQALRWGRRKVKITFID